MGDFRESGGFTKEMLALKALAMRLVRRLRGDEDLPRAIRLESFLVVPVPPNQRGAPLGTEVRR
jgi:hypothetical protein